MNYDFKSFIHGVRGTEPQFNGYCPFHNDRSPSFSFNSETGLWKCHAGCGAGTYQMFLQMFRSDLEYSRRVVSVRPPSRNPKSQMFKPVAEYLYQNTQGRTCLRVKRFESSTGSKTFSQESMSEDGRWIPRGTQEVLAPYLYDSWKNSDQTVLFVEGEKCADMLSRLRFASTTIPGGAGAWKETFAPFFEGKVVRILPDNDLTGIKFANLVLATLKPVTKDIRIVILPDLPHAGDVWNWFNDSSDKSDSKKTEEFLKLID